MLDAGTALVCYSREVDLRFNTVNTGEQHASNPAFLYAPYPCCDRENLSQWKAHCSLWNSGHRAVPFEGDMRVQRFTFRCRVNLEENIYRTYDVGP